MGGGSKQTTTKNNPWEDMPEWQRQAYEDDADFRKALLAQGQGVADQLASDPRNVLGPSAGERQGLETMLAAGGRAQDLSDIASGRLGQDYESAYTDDVVDTTLAGMERERQRQRLIEDSRAAAVGGTSNTRAAVSQAVGDTLSGMNMAQMEGQLRDQGHRFGSEMGLKEAQLADSMATSELARGGVLGSAQSGYGELERSLSQQQMDAQRNAGQEAYSWLGNLFAGTNGQKGPHATTQTTTQPGQSGFSSILGAASSLGGMFMMSDENVKHDITDQGGSALDKLKGLSAKEYEYDEGFGHTKDRTTGLMAQDIERAGITGAVKEIDGVKQVDPYPVLATVVQAVKELEAKVKDQ